MPGEALRGGGSYTEVAKGLHWLVAALVVIQFATKLVPPGAMSEDALDAWHIAIGPTILLAMLVRLAWRATHTPPPTPTDIPAPLQLLARATHWAFYALLIVMPVIGWVSASAFGARPTLLGLFGLPLLAAKDKAVAERWGDIHGVLAWVVLALIALHVAGAVYHAAIKKDGVLARMLPGGYPDAR